MASLYKNNGTWYVSTYVNGTRISKSLKTKKRKTAYSIMPSVLSNLLNESNHLNNDISFKQLTDLFQQNHLSGLNKALGLNLIKVNQT